MIQNNDSPKTLPEVCADFFALVIQLRVTKQYGDYNALFRKVQMIFDAIDYNAKKNDIPARDVEDVKYGLCALFDQMILSSDCPFKDEWAARPLELHYFGKCLAGVEFFNKLESIRSQIETRGDLAEVYYYCLTHGFEGKYRIEGAEKLNLLINNLALELKRLRKGGSDKLSVQWELPQSLIQKVVRLVPPWVVGVIALFIIFLVFITLKTVIGSDAVSLMSELKGISSKL
jgi:type VI secretion system protein ImpK